MRLDVRKPENPEETEYFMLGMELSREAAMPPQVKSNKNIIKSSLQISSISFLKSTYHFTEGSSDDPMSFFPLHPMDG